jgi:hypothetical protein
MRLNTKKDFKTKFSSKLFFKYLMNTFIISFVSFIITISSFHFILNDNIREKAFKKIDYYFTPLSLENYNIKNIFYFFKGLFLSLDNDDIIYINSNFKNTNLFKSQLEDENKITSGNNFNFSKGKFIWNSDKVNIKFRPKGDRKIHYKKNKPSFRIKIRQGDATLDGVKEFSLHDAFARNYITEFLWYELLSKENIITPFIDYKKLYFNGEDLGIYNVEEVPTTFTLERLNKRNSSILKFDESFSTNILDNPEIKIINSNDVDFLNQQRAFDLFKNFLENKKMDGIFNIEKMASFFAISNILNIQHGLYSKSMRFYLDPITMLFEPIPFDGHDRGLKITEGYEGIFLSIEAMYSDRNNFWLNFFFNYSNQNFIKLYYEKLNYYLSEEFFNIISDEGFFENANNKLLLIYKGFPLEDRISYKGPFPYIQSIETDFKNKVSIIKNKIEKLNVQFYLDVNKKEISIINLSKIPFPIFIRDITSKNYVENKQNFILFENHYPNYSLENILIKNDSLFQDVLINKDLDIIIGDGTVRKVNLFNYDNKKANSSKKEQAYNDHRVTERNDTLFFNKINTILNNDLLIPKGKTLVISEKQKLKLNNSILKIEGNLVITGEIENKVEVSTTENGGQIIQIGGQSFIKNCIFKNFNLSNKKSLNTSSLTFYKSKIEILNTEFISNQHEDFLNLVSSDVILKNINFRNCNSDCLDSDFSNGIFEEIYFSNSGNDGVDFSGSNIQVRNIFLENISDKAISVGEGSIVDFNNINIQNSEIGVVSKDGSKLRIESLKTNNVKVPMSNYIKKSRFKNSFLSVKNYSIIEYDHKHLIQKGLMIELDGNSIFGNIEDVERMFYGNEYGIKTTR